jgi:hypothetical protein
MLALIAPAECLVITALSALLSCTCAYLVLVAANHGEKQEQEKEQVCASRLPMHHSKNHAHFG